MLCGELIMTDRFDFDEALKAIQSGQAISGKDGVLAPLIKQLTEAAINAITDKIIATVEAWQGDSPIWPSSSSQLKNDL